MKATLSSNHRVLPAVVGHRGACGHAPENTLVSIRRAAGLGAEWVEFDVKLTSDGKVILFHDDTLERTTNGEGNVSTVTLSDIRNLDAGSWFSGEFAGERVPTLKAAIKLLHELDLGANIEIKPLEGQEVETAEAVCSVIADFWPKDKPLPLISSFKDDSLAVVRDRLPDHERALLMLEVPDDWQVRAEMLGCNAVHVWHEPLTQQQVEDMRVAGYPVRCYTVNDPDIAKRLWDWGVESIVSDYPDRMVALGLPRPDDR